MKSYLLPLLVFVLISCATNKVPERYIAASGMPARIVKVISPKYQNVEFSKDLKVSVKLKAFKFGTAVAKNRNVKFELTSGQVKLLNPSSKTNNEGVASVDIEVLSYPTSIGLKYRIDNVIKTLRIEVTRPDKFIEDYSVNHSSFISDKSETIANGINIVNFKLQIKNAQDQAVSAYGLDVQLNIDGDIVKMNELGDGVYEYNYRVPSKSGSKKIQASVEGQTLAKNLTLNLLPDLVIVERFLKAYKNKNDQYEVQFSIKEKSGGFIQSLDGINIRPTLDGEGTYSEIKYDPQLYRFYYFFYPPKATGRTKVGVHFAGNDYWAAQSFEYDFAKVDPSQTEVSIEDKRIVPTGIDYLSFNVKLKNSEGEVLKITNPKQYPKILIDGEAELEKQIIDFKANDLGVFEGKIIPRKLKEKLLFSVEYDDKIVFEQELHFSMEPLKDNLSLKRNSESMSNFDDLDVRIIDKTQDWKVKAGQMSAFVIHNEGGNEIIPTGCSPDTDSNNCQAEREYKFTFEEQARQNMMLVLTDWPSNTFSKMMHAWIYFFPRKVVPHYYWSEDKTKLHVVLPTNEEVIFDAKTKMIVGGVLEEGPIDLGPSRHSRRFPLLRYKGKGVVLRINARGQDGRLGNWNRTKISGDFGDTGAQGVMIYKYNPQTDLPDVCRASKPDFWPQEDTSPIPFNYPSDESFAAFLKEHCGMELSLD